jgi:nucleotide-binding universal stress UspA family protein
VYEDSEASERAFQCVLAMAQSSRGIISIAGIVTATEFAIDFVADAALESACGDLRAKVARLERRARFAGLEVTSFVLIGQPTQKILHVAAEWQADLIVTAQRPTGILGHWLCHSMASAIMTRAPCAALMIR